MAEVTREMILDYMIKKGGVVKNVDLVKHFRKYLQIESAAEKGMKCSYLVRVDLIGQRYILLHHVRPCWGL